VDGGGAGSGSAGGLQGGGTVTELKDLILAKIEGVANVTEIKDLIYVIFDVFDAKGAK
jgi:hypothetical protein